MTKNRKGEKWPDIIRIVLPPVLNIGKIGIISRDYRHRYPNGIRDFSHSLPDVMKLLDEKGCDAVLFSLYSIVPRKSYEPQSIFNRLKNLKAVFLEEFDDGEKRKAGRYVVHYQTASGWKEYSFSQVFGTLSGVSKNEIEAFVKSEMPKRILGNSCVLLCGETNGVKYSRQNKKVEDIFGLKEAIPPKSKVILNPIHDRMTRYEMKLKRQFLSKQGRWVISVWNKGKEDKSGRTRDGKNPPWTIFHNGRDVSDKASIIGNQLDLDIGVLDVV